MGSCNFIHSRREVKCFLQSAANYWLEEYHFDGLRMDAVSRLIYWQGDERRGVNGAAIEFLKDMNLGLKQRHPEVMLIAEDSTSYPGVTKPVYEEDWASIINGISDGCMTRWNIFRRLLSTEAEIIISLLFL